MHLPIILVTASLLDETTLSTLTDLDVTFIHKPYTSDELITPIRKLLGQVN